MSQSSPRRFEALELSLEVVRSLRASLVMLRSSNPDLYRQIRRAASSVALNVSEGAGRQGRDRKQLWTVAYGSAREVQTALRVALAWGDLKMERVQGSIELLDRLLAMLWRLSR